MIYGYFVIAIVTCQIGKAMPIGRWDTASFSCRSPSARCQTMCEVECGLRARSFTTFDTIKECLDSMTGPQFHACEYEVMTTMTYKLHACQGTITKSEDALRLQLPMAAYTSQDFLMPSRTELHSFLVWVENGHCQEAQDPAVALSVTPMNADSDLHVPVWQREVMPGAVVGGPPFSTTTTAPPPGCVGEEGDTLRGVEAEDIIFSYPSGMILNVTSWARTIESDRATVPSTWEISSHNCKFPQQNDFYITADQTAYILMGSDGASTTFVGGSGVLALGVIALVTLLY